MDNLIATQQQVIAAVGKNAYWLIIVTVGLLSIEFIRLISAAKSHAREEDVEKTMVKEGVPKKQAEKEVKEKSTVVSEEKKEDRIVIEEFVELKKLYEEIKKADSSELLGAASKKFKDLHKEESLEKKLDKRLRGLFKKAEKLAKDKPAKKSAIDEKLLEINSANRQLIALMGKGGRFEIVVDTEVHAGLTLDQKRAQLLEILREAISFDEKIHLAIGQLNSIITS